MTKNDMTKDGCHCSEKEIAEQKGKESSKEKSTVYLATDGVSATPEENEDGSWKVIIQTTVEGEITEDTRVIKLVQMILNPKGKTLSVGGKLIDKNELQEKGKTVATMEIKGGESPLKQEEKEGCFKVRTQLSVNGELSETKETEFHF